MNYLLFPTALLIIGILLATLLLSLAAIHYLRSLGDLEDPTTPPLPVGEVDHTRPFNSMQAFGYSDEGPLERISPTDYPGYLDSLRPTSHDYGNKNIVIGTAEMRKKA